VANEGNRDIVLAPGEYAYVQDTTKGLVGTLTGPSKISMSNTDQPVVWDKIRFKRVDADKAIQLNAIAPEGFYIALFNPAAGDKHPAVGTSSNTADLQVGHRINIHGPVNFALFPGQMADVIRGHHIRSNQYLLAQVYNDAAATANWNNAVLKPQGGAGETPQATVLPRTFTNGQLLIIKGTEVAFFMPPTGIKVVQDDADNYVRDAVTSCSTRTAASGSSRVRTWSFQSRPRPSSPRTGRTSSRPSN
jgi:major vault protein